MTSTEHILAKFKKKLKYMIKWQGVEERPGYHWCTKVLWRLLTSPSIYCGLIWKLRTLAVCLWWDALVKKFTTEHLDRALILRQRTLKTTFSIYIPIDFPENKLKKIPRPIFWWVDAQYKIMRLCFARFQNIYKMVLLSNVFCSSSELRFEAVWKTFLAALCL